MRRKTTEEFIAEARAVHGDLYDYSKVQYNGMHTKVLIIDPVYGEFMQRPNDHIRGGNGHPTRGGRERLSTEKFIAKARVVHGEVYDYSKVHYINNKTKVLIIDPEFGEFWQTSGNHLSGQGHTKRGEIIRVEKRSSSTDEFIAKAMEVHGDLYDYSKVHYINTYSKVLIVDPVYGSFEQAPSKHLQGCGHPVRGNLLRGSYWRSNTEEFIAKALKVHGDLYDYSKVQYVRKEGKVLIIDPVYGEFWQRANVHLRGAGHPSRAKSGFDTQKPGVLYINIISLMSSLFRNTTYKIGIAGVHCLNDRIQKQRRGSPEYSTEHLHLWECSLGLHVDTIETKIIKKYNLYNNHALSKEQYEDGSTETFSSSMYNSIMQDVQKLIKEHNLTCSEGEEIRPMVLQNAAPEVHQFAVQKKGTPFASIKGRTLSLVKF